MWCLNALGGADVKVLMILTDLFSDLRLVYVLLPAWLLLSLVYLLAHHGRTSLQTVQGSSVRLIQFRLSTATTMTDITPALPAIALAGAVNLWMF